MLSVTLVIEYIVQFWVVCDVVGGDVHTQQQREDEYRLYTTTYTLHINKYTSSLFVVCCEEV